MGLFLIILLLPVVVFFVLLFILKTIGVITYHPYVESYECDKSKLDDSKKEVKLLQYNVFWRPWLFHLGKIEYVRERARILSERLDEYDVVCLNESFNFGSTVAKEFISTMRKRGFNYFVTIKRIPFFSHWVVDGGIMIMSKYPIVKTDSVLYKDGCSFDKYAAKGCLYAKVQISKSQHINVFATHLQASYNTITSVDLNVRQSQVKQINELMMKNVSSDDAPLFLLGDMNINYYNTKEYNTMMDGLKIPNHNLVDVLRLNDYKVNTIAVEEDNTLTLDSDKHRPKSIDYIFSYEHKDNNQIAKCTATVLKMPVKGLPYPQLSDHEAVYGLVEFK